MFNIFSLVIGSIFFSIILAMLITRKGSKVVTVLPEDDFSADKPFPVPISTVQQVAERLCRSEGLVVKEIIQVADFETYWVAESKSPVFAGQYVMGIREVKSSEDLVSLSAILEFKDFIKSVGSTKGLYLTNGFFTRDVYQPLEGPRVSLYNAKKVLESSYGH